MSPLPSPSLLAAELLKVRKRWLLYVLFLVMVAGAAFNIWMVGFGSWLGDRNNPDAGYGIESLRTFALPYSLPTLLDSGQFWGAVLVGILVSSAVGTEYGWGTIRQAVLRGQTRSEFLTLKLLGIGMLFSAIATSIANEDVPGSLSVGEALLMVLRAGYAIIPYGVLAFALTTIGRSTTLGVAGTLMFIIIESILIAIFGGLERGWADDVRAFFPGHNALALLAANRIESEGSFFSLAPRESLSPGALPDPAVAALVLAIYSAVLLAVTYYIFNRRDLGR